MQSKNMMFNMIDDTINCLSNLRRSKTSLACIEELSKDIRNIIYNDGTIYLTGIGKPGYIAQKQAATLKSIMVDGQYIDATLAGHGDLGPIPVNKPSLLIAMSKSGCSLELYKLFDVVKQLRPMCKVVMICMSNDVQLNTVMSCINIDSICRITIDPKELDGYGIVPTTSNVMFEVVMSMAISNAFDCEELGMKNMCERLKMSHPSGTLYNKVSRLLENFEN